MSKFGAWWDTNKTILFDFVSIAKEKSVRMNKNQVEVWGSAVSSPGGVRGIGPEALAFSVYLA